MTTKGMKWRVKTRKRQVVKPTGRFTKRQHDPLAHNGMIGYMNAHFEWMQVVGYSPDTGRTSRTALRRFITWGDERGLNHPSDVSKQVLERYQRHLFYYRKPDGKPLTLSTQASCLAPLKLWFKWLARENHILFNPASELDVPRRGRQLPRVILSIQEVEAVLAEAEGNNPSSLRDRAMLELLYSTGIRRTEASHLALYDVDLDRRLVMVREGKGRKDRMVPIGARALAWLDKYLLEGRPQLIGPELPALFVTDYGEAATPELIAHRVKVYKECAGIHKPGAAHLLRHACATHMLEGGADIRFIQVLLGHESLESTEIYTHVAITKLQAIHEATHPARLHRLPQEEPARVASEAAHEALAALLADDPEEAE